MSSTELTQPSRQAIAAKTASKPRRVTGKLAVACKAIAWEGKELDQAAKDAGLTTRTLRLALERRHVIVYLKEQRDVFRAYVSSQNIHHAKLLRDTTGNAMAKVNVMKYIDDVAEAQQSRGFTSSSPGFVINVIGSVTTSPHTPHIRETEHKPLIDHGDVGRSDDER